MIEQGSGVKIAYIAMDKIRMTVQSCISDREIDITTLQFDACQSNAGHPRHDAEARAADPTAEIQNRFARLRRACSSQHHAIERRAKTSIRLQQPDAAIKNMDFFRHCFSLSSRTE